MKQTEFNFADTRNKKESHKDKRERNLYEYNERRFLGNLGRMSEVLNRGSSTEGYEIRSLLKK
jgi:hypothetical protein